PPLPGGFRRVGTPAWTHEEPSDTDFGGISFTGTVHRRTCPRLGGFCPRFRRFRVIPGGRVWAVSGSSGDDDPGETITPIAGHSRRAVELIGALVPAPLPRTRPSGAALPVLPARRCPTGQDVPVLDLARLDRSGRLSTRSLLAALDWHPGQRADALVIAPSVDGRHMIGSRGALTLPVAARTYLLAGAGSACCSSTQLS